MVIGSDKNIYHSFCENNRALPVFFTPIWLDLVCGAENWEVKYLIENGKIVAVFPYHIKEKFGLKANLMPRLTPYLGYWSEDVDNNNEYKSKSQKLISSLPDVAYHNISLHPSIVDGLPFHWNNYQQSLRYTFIIEADLIENVTSRMSNKLLSDLRYAEDKVTIEVVDEVDELYSMIHETFAKQGMDVPFSRNLIESIKHKLDHKAKIYLARDQNNVTQAAMMALEDEHFVYNLLSGRSRNAIRGSVGKMLWFVIKDCMDRNKNFDFEGSSLAGVEQFYRSFGGKLTTFISLRKTKNRMLNLLFTLLGK